MARGRFEEQYFEDPNFPPGLKGGDEVRGYGYYPDYFPIVEAQLATLIELTGARTLLDAGCGKGALAAYARRDLGVAATGADASRYGVFCARYALGGERTVRCDCARLPFVAEAFDVVWCNGVLQYMEADAARAALAGMARVARTAVFVSNIAAAQRQTEWGRRDRLTRLYLRPRQWASLAVACLPPAAGWQAVALPFEGESAILLHRPPAAPSFPLRFVDLALERMRRLGALVRTPPTLASWRLALPRR
ncbi:MAG TPA: methyltransferase domain-containing protein [Terriglobales bacterium]|nr:methyltransferase domain-containing protein [Terriglobales bacterium]